MRPSCAEVARLTAFMIQVRGWRGGRLAGRMAGRDCGEETVHSIVCQHSRHGFHAAGKCRRSCTAGAPWLAAAAAAATCGCRRRRGRPTALSRAHLCRRGRRRRQEGQSRVLSVQSRPLSGWDPPRSCKRTHLVRQTNPAPAQWRARSGIRRWRSLRSQLSSSQACPLRVGSDPCSFKDARGPSPACVAAAHCTIGPVFILPLRRSAPVHLAPCLCGHLTPDPLAQSAVLFLYPLSLSIDAAAILAVTPQPKDVSTCLQPRPHK